MATYDVQHRIKLIGFFYFSETSIIETQRKYRQHFNVRVSPSNNMIRNLIVRFERNRSVGNFSGRDLKRTVRTDAAMEAVRQSILEDPSVILLSVVALLN